MSLSIAQATPAELDEIATWRYEPPYDFYDGDQEPVLNPERFFMARDGQKLVGFYYFEERGDVLEYGLGLRPDLVGRGLGPAFFRAGLDFGRERFGPERVTLAVAAFNDRARIVYERAGFAVTGRHMRSFERWGDVEFIDMEQESPTFRRGTRDDIPELAKMRRDFTFEDGVSPERDGYEDDFARVVGDGITSGRWAVWVAEVDGEIVSHMFVGLVDKIPRPTREPRWLGYLTNVYTRRAHRNLGIGAALLERVTAWARKSDVELLVVWPSEESLQFYERAGFASGRDPLVWEP